MMSKVKYSEKAKNSILDIVIKNFDYFRDNPKHLAWVMMKWNLIHITCGDCEDNPKYSILGACELLNSKEDSDLLYDSWSVSIYNLPEFPDASRESFYKKLTKPNKTLSEWIDIKTDPLYEYSSLYLDDKSVTDHLLCVIGTGYGWNKDGFISKLGPSNIDTNIFVGYTLAEPEIRSDIRLAINKFLNSNLIKGSIDGYMKRVKVNCGYNQIEKDIVSGSYEIKCSLKDRPELLQKTQEAYEFVFYLEQLVEIAIKWDDKQWAEARNKSTWEYKNYTLKVSEVESDFSYSTFNFIFEINNNLASINDELRAIGLLYNARRSAWSSFVFKNNGHPDVKKAQKILRKRFGKNKASKKQLSRASEMLRKHQPNYKRYGEVYKRVCNGDAKAAKELDKAAGVPKPGWDSVKFIVDYEQKRRANISEEDIIEREKYYPLSDYSNMIKMPDNAHISYVEAGIKIAKEIIANKNEEKCSKKYAKKFLKKWNK